MVQPPPSQVAHSQDPLPVRLAHDPDPLLCPLGPGCSQAVHPSASPPLPGQMAHCQDPPFPCHLWARLKTLNSLVLCTWSVKNDRKLLPLQSSQSDCWSVAEPRRVQNYSERWWWQWLDRYRTAGVGRRRKPALSCCALRDFRVGDDRLLSLLCSDLW